MRPARATNAGNNFIAHPPGTGRPGKNNNTNQMAWRPNENLIDGELDNRTPESVTGWMRFFRRGQRPLKVSFDLAGDFHEDIRGKMIRLKNRAPSDWNESRDEKGTYMKGFSRMQRGTVGDITAGITLGPWTEAVAQKLMAQNELIWDEAGLGQSEREKRRQMFAKKYREHIEAGDLIYAYVDYPYIEWYSDRNGRVVLELDPSQVEIVGEGSPKKEKTPKELVGDEKKHVAALHAFMAGMVKKLSKENRNKGEDDNAFGVVIG